MKIGLKLSIAFFLIAFLPIVVIGYLAYNKGKDSLEQESFAKLTAVREMKGSQIEDYFQQIHDQVVTFSENPTIVEAMMRFKEAFHDVDEEIGTKEQELAEMEERVQQYMHNEFLPRLNKNLDEQVSLQDNISSEASTEILQDLYIASNPHDIGSKQHLDHPGDSSVYSNVHARFHPGIRNYLDKFGYYDIFLVDNKTGHIVYSVFKEVDYATSLLDGPFSNTNLAQAFVEAVATNNPEFVELEDFQPYPPSYNAPASFIASPIHNGSEQVGILIFQMPIDRINNIMTNKQEWAEVGLGNSGETYIVGSDYTLRNQSRFLIEDSYNYFKMVEAIGTPQSIISKIKSFGSTIGLQEVHTVGTEAALTGEKGTEIFDDYRGVSVLSAYRPLHIEGMNWAIMSEIDEEEAFIHVSSLRDNIALALGGMVIIILVASYIISRQITRPLKELTVSAKQLAHGNMKVKVTTKGKDEIGILALSFKKMQISIGNLIGELKEINENLEHKVVERTQEIQLQKEIVEEKNREIVDSINYAQRLQNAILPPMNKVKDALKQSFVLFKPKDIVSGDFFWMQKKDGKVLIAAVDCTGHGVPGAMVSVVGANSLDRCVNEFKLRTPSDIMEKLTDLVVETFAGNGNTEEVKDGMDMAMCSIDIKNRTLEYCGANNPLWIVRHQTIELEEIKANKQPIGQFAHRQPFTNHEVKLEEGDCVYLFSDGYADQFGGPKGKKFKYTTLKTLLVGIHERSMIEQRSILNEEFEKWKGDLEQIDDVVIIGIRF